MSLVSVVEVYTTKFSHCLFLLKIYENLMSIEKMHCNGSQNSLSPQILLINICSLFFYTWNCLVESFIFWCVFAIDQIYSWEEKRHFQ